MTTQSKTRGVTLVEIAIVLVIIGLLLGGVLKGQELINNAKVRSMADRQNSLKVAWFSFIDRYGAIPGDYVRALANVPGAQKSGNGDGLIAQAGEGPNVLQNLTGAGYLRCPQCTGSKTAETFSGNNSLVNQYGGVMGLYHGSQNYATIGGTSARLRLLVYTGQGIPSNIIAEVDRKIDDGVSTRVMWSSAPGRPTAKTRRWLVNACPKMPTRQPPPMRRAVRLTPPKRRRGAVRWRNRRLSSLAAGRFPSNPFLWLEGSLGLPAARKDRPSGRSFFFNLPLPPPLAGGRAALRQAAGGGGWAKNTHAKKS